MGRTYRNIDVGVSPVGVELRLGLPHRKGVCQPDSPSFATFTERFEAYTCQQSECPVGDLRE